MARFELAGLPGDLDAILIRKGIRFHVGFGAGHPSGAAARVGDFERGRLLERDRMGVPVACHHDDAWLDFFDSSGVDGDEAALRAELQASRGAGAVGGHRSSAAPGDAAEDGAGFAGRRADEVVGADENRAVGGVDPAAVHAAQGKRPEDVVEPDDPEAPPDDLADGGAGLARARPGEPQIPIGVGAVRVWRVDPRQMRAARQRDAAGAQVLGVGWRERGSLLDQKHRRGRRRREDEQGDADDEQAEATRGASTQAIGPAWCLQEDTAGGPVELIPELLEDTRALAHDAPSGELAGPSSFSSWAAW